jgi:hypothetical protein
MTTIPMKVTSAAANVDAARLNVLNFRQEHADVLGEYDILLDQYNAAVNDAKAQVKDNADILGNGYAEFAIVRSKKLDADVLEAVMGDAADAYLVISKSVDREKWNKDVGSGLIPQSVASVVEIDGSIQVRGPSEVGTWSVSGTRRKSGARR